ncbi:hypothetical protein DPMN_075785 [Dreissena polymorpha]|uniref:Uncharacterized protein n=1 Tax=Dreissena polymorpha TaxID=45954 RepID=A0A9D3YL22_DREPO|nr:hypothetical protein DPMN_075785 [Dreissena polymorpha]
MTLLRIGEYGRGVEQDVKESVLVGTTESSAVGTAPWVEVPCTWLERDLVAIRRQRPSPRQNFDRKRGLSAMKMVENRARLKSAVLIALMMVSIKGPDIVVVDFGKMMDAWHQEKPWNTTFLIASKKHSIGGHAVTRTIIGSVVIPWSSHFTAAKVRVYGCVSLRNVEWRDLVCFLTRLRTSTDRQPVDAAAVVRDPNMPGFYEKFETQYDAFGKFDFVVIERGKAEVHMCILSFADFDHIRRKGLRNSGESTVMISHCVLVDCLQLFSSRLSHSQLDARSAAWLSLWIATCLSLPSEVDRALFYDRSPTILKSINEQSPINRIDDFYQSPNISNPSEVDRALFYDRSQTILKSINKQFPITCIDDFYQSPYISIAVSDRSLTRL